MARMAQFGRITVKAPSCYNEQLHLTFKTRKVFDETLRQLRKKNVEITDYFWGFTMYTSAEAAMETVNFWTNPVGGL